MSTLSASSIAGVLFLAVLSGMLVLIGIINVRAGRKALVQAAGTVPWHKQASILFGINNFVFALLVFWGLCLIVVADRTGKYILFGLIVLTLIVSLLLVVRVVRSALQTTKR